MKFRPCIDIHNGKVKQIVGSSLRDEDDRAKENFVSEKDGAYYAKMYREKGLYGGHAILRLLRISRFHRRAASLRVQLHSRHRPGV